MNHLTEEELIAYRDGEARNRQSFAEHLHECAQCQHEMARLDAVFAALDAMPIPDPGDDFARRLWQEIAPRLPEKRHHWWQALLEPRRLLLAGAMAAVILLAFFIGRFTKKPMPGNNLATTTGNVRQRVLLVAVGDHLGRSEMILMEPRPMMATLSWLALSMNSSPSSSISPTVPARLPPFSSKPFKSALRQKEFC
jgi:hypothetical protein